MYTFPQKKGCLPQIVSGSPLEKFYKSNFDEKCKFSSEETKGLNLASSSLLSGALESSTIEEIHI